MGEQVDLRSVESELRDLYNKQLFVLDPDLARLEYLKFTRESRLPARQLVRPPYSELLHAPVTGEDLALVLQDAGNRLLPSADTTSHRFANGILDCYLEDNEAAPFAKISLAFAALEPTHVGRPIALHLSRIQEHRADEDVTLRQSLTLYRTTRYSPFEESDIRVTTIHLLSGIATEKRDDPVSRFVPLMESKDLLLIDDPMARQQETEQLRSMLQALEAAVNI